MSWQPRLSCSFSRCVDKNFSRRRKGRLNVKFDAKKRKLVQQINETFGKEPEGLTLSLQKPSSFKSNSL